MTLYDGQEHLEAEVKALLPGVSVQDNLVDKPSGFPVVVIEVDGSRVAEYGGGSQFTGVHDYVIWVIYEVGKKSIRESRQSVAADAESILGIRRLFCSERVEYGVDMIWDKRVVFAKISGSVG